MRVVYLAEQTGRVCPACQTVLSQEFDYCTTCGEFVGEHCESCHRRKHPDWTFCPYCGSDGRREERPAHDDRRAADGRLPRANARRKAS